MLFTSFLFTSFLALVKYGNIDQIRQKLYYHWCDREEKLLLFPEFVSRSARFLKVMRETAVHSFPDSRSPFPVLVTSHPDLSRNRRIVCFFEMHEFQITRKQLQVILARSSIIQAQSAVVFCFLTSYDVFGNLRTASNLSILYALSCF